MNDAPGLIPPACAAVSGRQYATSLPRSAAALRAKIVNCREGRADWIPELTSDPASPRKMAEQVEQFVEARVDRTRNPRIAILPFADAKDRRRAGAIGIETADNLESELKEKGYSDIIPPNQTQKLCEDAGLSAMSIDYEAGLVKGRIDADFMIIGWIRRNQPEPLPDATAAKPRPQPRAITKTDTADLDPIETDNEP